MLPLMGETIANFSDGSLLEFSQGSFDAYCVFLVRADGKRIPPKDTDYFGVMLSIGDLYGRSRVYDHFVEVFNATTTVVDSQVIELIRGQSVGYQDMALLYEKAMAMIYAGMIAENNKRNTRLGKRIKRLGMHVLLREEGSVTYSANFMRGKGWQELDGMCKARGF